MTRVYTSDGGYYKVSIGNATPSYLSGAESMTVSYYNANGLLEYSGIAAYARDGQEFDSYGASLGDDDGLRLSVNGSVITKYIPQNTRETSDDPYTLPSFVSTVPSYGITIINETEPRSLTFYEFDGWSSSYQAYLVERDGQEYVKFGNALINPEFFENIDPSVTYQPSFQVLGRTYEGGYDTIGFRRVDDIWENLGVDPSLTPVFITPDRLDPDYRGAYSLEYYQSNEQAFEITIDLSQAPQGIMTHEADVFEGSSANDHVFAGRGDDTLRGGAGDDRLFGEGGRDVVYAGDGDDFVETAEVVYAGDGNDSVYSGQEL